MKLPQNHVAEPVCGPAANLLTVDCVRAPRREGAARREVQSADFGYYKFRLLCGRESRIRALANPEQEARSSSNRRSILYPLLGSHDQ
jgi:hypothetical protein